MLTFTAQRLHDVTRRIFEGAGTPPDLAAQMADVLVEANLAGHDSHGVIRIPAYVDAIHQGSLVPAARPEVIQETPGSALVDGKYGFGHIAAAFGTDVAVRKAKESKAVVVSIVRCNHIGRVGEWGSRAAAQGVIAIVTVGGGGGPGAAAPFGGAARALGTNPISIGIPAGEQPDMLVDFATTAVAEGKIQVARAKKAPLPPGCILDKDGNPSTNPEDFYAGGMLLPFGGHKGYALSMVVEMLGSALSPGQHYNREGRGGAAVIIAVDATTFRPRDDYDKAADSTLSRIKSIPPARGFSEVLLPGEPELRSKAERLETGIPVAEATWEAIIKASQSVGVTIE
ncbi:MAG TPA: Ldh family oxidoreductase [Chloroflexota bacterium]|nr:Ldh family oxidoreductase [Chloroflexota bacterium]